MSSEIINNRNTIKTIRYRRASHRRLALASVAANALRHARQPAALLVVNERRRILSCFALRSLRLRAKKTVSERLLLAFGGKAPNDQIFERIPIHG